MNECCNPVSALSGGESIFTAIRWPKARAPRRAEALAVFEQIIPWQRLEEIARPHYHADRRATGRPGYSLRMMLHCWILLWFWQLSDDGVESLVLDSHATAKFIGSDPWAPRPPSASKIREFRKLLAFKAIGPELEIEVHYAFAVAGLQVRTGAIVEPVFRSIPRRSE